MSILEYALQFERRFPQWWLIAVGLLAAIAIFIGAALTISMLDAEFAVCADRGGEPVQVHGRVLCLSKDAVR